MIRVETPRVAAPRPAGSSADDFYVLRNAEVEDGSKIWQLVRDSQVLDTNSAYTYLLLCRQFRDTCVVAEAGDEVAGFVTAYLPPAEPRTLFVWQIGVELSHRGHGLAGRLLDHAVALPACRDVEWLTATVTPDNTASQALFHSFARRNGAECRVVPYFDRELFPGDGHEPEELYRIGPLTDPASSMQN